MKDHVIHSSILETYGRANNELNRHWLVESSCIVINKHEHKHGKAHYKL